MLSKSNFPLFKEIPCGTVIGQVQTMGVETYEETYETAAWYRMHEAPPQIADLRLGLYPYGCTFTAPLRAVATLKSAITSACLVSLFGGVAYGPDTAGEREVGKEAEFTISMPLHALFGLDGCPAYPGTPKHGQRFTRLNLDLRPKLREAALAEAVEATRYYVKCCADIVGGYGGDDANTKGHPGMISHYAEHYLTDLGRWLDALYSDRKHEAESSCHYRPQWLEPYHGQPSCYCPLPVIAKEEHLEEH